MTFGMRRKPIKPLRKTGFKEIGTVSSNSDGHILLTTLILRAKNSGFTPKDCTITLGSYCNSMVILWSQENDDDYEKRLVRYKERLKVYRKWQLEHADEIEADTQQKLDAKVEKHIAVKKRKKARLKAREAKVKQQIKELEAKVKQQIKELDESEIVIK